jgi:hypothetical protein
MVAKDAARLLVEGEEAQVLVLLSNTLMKMKMIISPFGQLGLWAPSSGAQDVFTSTAYVFTSLTRD